MSGISAFRRRCRSSSNNGAACGPSPADGVWMEKSGISGRACRLLPRCQKAGLVQLDRVERRGPGMAAPKTTVWKLDPHTRAKHEILRRYLQAWTPILTQGGFPKVAYMDGFPIIALKAALDHSNRISGQVIFVFVEEKQDRAEFLRQIVQSMSLPKNFVVEIHGGKTFE